MIRQFLAKNSFWMSLFLHLLVLLWLVLAFLLQPPAPIKKDEKTPHYYVPAYTYTGSIKPAPSSATHHQMQNPTPEEASLKKAESKEAEDQEIPVSEKPIKEKPNTVPIQKKMAKGHTTKLAPPKSMFLTSLDMLKQDQLDEISRPSEQEPVYLIGDDNSPADPLIKLMGRSLSAHFHYPRTAGELGIKGKVLIGLTLHPEGHYSDVELIRSSNNQDLDAAALYAVNSAPRVVGADRYLSKPRHFIIGFVFY